MKSAISLAVLVALVASPIPAHAQPQVAAPNVESPLATAIARAAVRLAADPQTGSDDSEWAHVMALAPGTAIVVTAKGAQPMGRRFLRATDSELVVLTSSNRPCRLL